MANIVWILALCVLAVHANDIKGVLPKPLPEGDDIRTEHLPFLDLTKSKPLELKNGKDMQPETILLPIEPQTVVFPKTVMGPPMFPSFFNPGQIFGMPQTIDSDDDSNGQQPQKHGILTIILVKSKHPKSQISDDIAPDATQFKQNLLNSAEDRFQSLTQFLLSDLFGQQQAPGEAIKQPERAHLLGGRDDPDHGFQGFGFKDEQGSDFIRFMKGGEIGDNMGMDNRGEHHGHHGKKCDFMKYLKLKAHIHYRTIVHLVFISGILLMILLMISLTIKVHKRRNALRRYAQQNINVSSIDSALAKHQEAEGQDMSGQKQNRLFRSGVLRTSYEQKMMPSVLVVSGPPAYEQIDEDNKTTETTKTSSSLIKSLVQNYKNRYQRMASDSQDDDRKSISSLPAYEEKPEPKE